MIEMTERAKKELKAILLNENVNYPGSYVRLKTNPEGKLALGLDVERPDDKAILYDDMKLLVVEEQLADALENIIIDVIDADKGKKFIVKNAAG